MNNAWTAIAFRASCAAARPSRRPIRELFHGYTRHETCNSANQGKRRFLSYSLTPSFAGRPPSGRTARYVGVYQQAFSNSAVLSKRNTRSRQLDHSKTPANSKIEPAPTVATHTEGLSDESQELTWRDYDPQGGMPLPDGERSQAQINSVFGDEQVDAETGNYILNVIYWRRASGALIDVGIRFPNDSRVTDRQAAKALEYIRSLDPSFDEQAAAQVWAEEESVRLQQQLEDRAVKLRLYKRDEPQEEEEEAEEDQGTAYGRSRNRESQLEQLQASNEAIKEAEAARKAVAEAKAEGSALHTHRGPLELAGGVQPSVEMVTYTGRDGITISRPKQQAWLQPVERKPWVSYYERQAELFPSESIPQLSILQRLGPSFAFLLLLLGLAVFVSENYTPPPNSARLWPDIPPSVATLSALTGTFFAFFLLSRVPPLWRTLNKYFTVVPAYPHAFGILGAAFRHQRLSHLLFNSLSLWLFGLILHEDVGRGAFLSIFFLSGALGAYTSLSYHVLRRHWATYIFGSSGCVLGVVAAATTLHPNSTIKVFGQDVPIAVWLWLALYGVAEAVAMFRFKGLGIDHAGHLGGLVGGFASALWLQQKARERKIALGREAESAVPVEVNEVKAAPS